MSVPQNLSPSPPREFRREGHHQLRDIVVQITNEWNDRLRLPLTGVPESYRRNKLGVLCQVVMPFGLGDYSLLVTQCGFLEYFGRNGNGGTGDAQDEFLVFVRNV